jgi:GPH family glycoside/pentoside/hexuronide:cation symporter
MAGTLIALFVMRDYDVTEERSNEIQAELARIKATKKSTAGFIRNKLQTLDEEFKGIPLIDLSNKSNGELRTLFAQRIKKAFTVCASALMKKVKTG